MKILVAGDSMGHLFMFDYTNGQLMASIKAHDDIIIGLEMQFDSSDDLVISTSKESFINVYKLTKHGFVLLQSIKESALTII